MDHARSFDFCQQLPRHTITNVNNADLIYSRQVLLNETWANFCKRRNKPEFAHEEHEKWITETWDDYLRRAQTRARTLAEFDAANDSKIAQKAAADDDRATVSDSVVATMMAAEKRRIDNTRHPCSLTLLLDFEELRQQRFMSERQAVEDEAAAKRQWHVQEMEEGRKALLAAFHKRLQEMVAAVEAQRRAEQAARERAVAAKKAEEEKKKAEEEAKRRAELEAERRRRAEEEEAKRLERKRKEDERRAKAKAERDARNKSAIGGGGKPTSAGGQEGDDERAGGRGGRDARLKRQNDAIASDSGLIDQIRELAASVKCEFVEDFFEQLMEILSPGENSSSSSPVFFHTCVYVGSLASTDDAQTKQQQQQQHLEYFAATRNCSELLREGKASLSVADSPTLQGMISSAAAATASSSLRSHQHVGPLPCHTLKHIGSPSQQWPPANGGEAAFFPITVNGQLWGTITLDTASSNATDADGSFRLPDEAGCYSNADSVGGECTEPVSITQEMISFMEEVAGIASSAASALPSRRGAAAVAGKSGKFGFDLEKVRACSSLAQALAAVSALIRSSAATVVASSAASSQKEGASSSPSPAGAPDCYISMLQKQKDNNRSALVVAHNGYSILGEVGRFVEADPSAPRHLIGGRINSSTNGNAKTFSLPTTADKPVSCYVPDVAADAACALFDRALTPQQKAVGESLLLIPIVVPAAAHSDNNNNSNNSSGSSSSSSSSLQLWGAIGISNVSAELATEITNFFWQHIRPLLLGAVKSLALLSVCNQAVEWLKVATGCRNIYVGFSLTQNKKKKEQLAAAPLRIVAASDGVKQLVHQMRTDSGAGLSHAFLAAAAQHTQDAGATLKHLPSLASVPNLKLWHSEGASAAALQKAQGVMCVISQNVADANVHGILYGDTLVTDSSKGGSDTITASDMDMFRLTANLLAATLDGEQETTDGDDKKQQPQQHLLAIETEATNAADFAFLGRLYRHATGAIRGITNGQLQELARYPAPPPVIPTTVAAAVALLGNSKITIAWDKLRPLIKQPLIDQISAFDPTSPSVKVVKKKCVIKARTLTKGLTATDVFTKGSHPASCLFTWIFICLLLRKFAKAVRDGQEQPKTAAASAAALSGAAAAAAPSPAAVDAAVVAALLGGLRDNDNDDDDDNDDVGAASSVGGDEDGDPASDEEEE